MAKATGKRLRALPVWAGRVKQAGA